MRDNTQLDDKLMLHGKKQKLDIKYKTKMIADQILTKEDYSLVNDYIASVEQMKAVQELELELICDGDDVVLLQATNG